MYTNLAYVTPTYRRVKKLLVLIINKDVRQYIAHKMEMRIPSGSGTTHLARQSTPAMAPVMMDNLIKSRLPDGITME